MTARGYAPRTGGATARPIASADLPSRATPGSFVLRRRLLGAMALAPLAGCSPRLNWREVLLPEAQCVVALPDKPQRTERELDLAGRNVTMSMTSTGVGPSLFALGVARLPAEAISAEALPGTLAWFRDGLLRNVQGKLTATEPAPLRVPAGRKLLAAEAIRAQGQVASGRGAELAARFYVVDDRLYQLVALAAQGEVGADALATFFDSFRLLD